MRVSPKNIKPLNNVFVHQLRAYDNENRVAKALPQVIKRAPNPPQNKGLSSA